MKHFKLSFKQVYASLHSDLLVPKFVLGPFPKFLGHLVVFPQTLNTVPSDGLIIFAVLSRLRCRSPQMILHSFLHWLCHTWSHVLCQVAHLFVARFPRKKLRRYRPGVNRDRGE